MSELKYLQVDGMGIFLEYLRWWWNPIMRIFHKSKLGNIYKMGKVLKRFNRKGIKWVNFFCWAYENGGLYRKFIPWKVKKGVYDFDKPNKKYWKGFKAWLDFLHNCGEFPLPCAFMDRYNYYPFNRNINGIHGFWDEAALDYQAEFVDDVIYAVRNEYPKLNLRFRMINEPAHAGRHDMLHRVADWHKDLYETSILWGVVPPKRLYIDVSLSEAGMAHFVEKHKCPKCDEYFGGTDYLTKSGKRQVQICKHGMSIWRNLIGDYDAWLSSSWVKPHIYWLGSDGGAGELKHLAHGLALFYGNKDNPKWKTEGSDGHLMWAQGNASETGKMLRDAFKRAKERGGKQCGYQIALFGTLRGWPLEEKFRLENIDWDRINACVNAHKKYHD